jgi:hypothetical protein
LPDAPEMPVGNAAASAPSAQTRRAGSQRMQVAYGGTLPFA